MAGRAALEVAFAHLCFNVFGAAIFFPVEAIRRIPVRLATALGNLMSRNRAYALAYITLVFFVIPLLVIAVTQPDDGSEPASPADTVQTAPVDSMAAE